MTRSASGLSPAVLVLVALVSLFTGFGLYYALTHLAEPGQPPAPTAPPARETAAPRALLGQRRPDFRLPDLDGRMRAIGEWDGKVVLLNFWATWCPPCRREIPLLVDLKAQYGPRGFEILGLADDQPQAVRDFLKAVPINYPVLLAFQTQGRLAARLGNRQDVLPYSVLLDRQGRIVMLRAGELTRGQLVTELERLL